MGFAQDDERLKGNAGGNCWKELLERIRDIRSSGKMPYRQVFDLYAVRLKYEPQVLIRCCFSRLLRISCVMRLTDTRRQRL